MFRWICHPNEKGKEEIVSIPIEGVRGWRMSQTAARQGAEILPLLSGAPSIPQHLPSIHPGAADAPLAAGRFASTAAALPAGHAG